MSVQVKSEPQDETVVSGSYLELTDSGIQVEVKEEPSVRQSDRIKTRRVRRKLLANVKNKENCEYVHKKKTPGRKRKNVNDDGDLGDVSKKRKQATKRTNKKTATMTMSSQAENVGNSTNVHEEQITPSWDDIAELTNMQTLAPRMNLPSFTDFSSCMQSQSLISTIDSSSMFTMSSTSQLRSSEEFYINSTTLPQPTAIVNTLTQHTSVQTTSSFLPAFYPHHFVNQQNDPYYFLNQQNENLSEYGVDLMAALTEGPGAVLMELGDLEADKTSPISPSSIFLANNDSNEAPHYDDNNEVSHNDDINEVPHNDDSNELSQNYLLSEEQMKLACFFLNVSYDSARAVINHVLSLTPAQFQETYDSMENLQSSSNVQTQSQQDFNTHNDDSDSDSVILESPLAHQMLRHGR